MSYDSVGSAGDDHVFVGAESFSAARDVIDSVESDNTSGVMFLQATKVEMIPFGSLVESPANVRKSALTGIADLAANIEAVGGVLQNLIVHAIEKTEGKGKAKKTITTYGVAAGRRRVAALALLRDQGKILNDFPVPVKLVSEAEAVLVSLSENEARAGMPPVDQIVAFKALSEAGYSVAHIASVGVVSELVVRQRLKLGNVSSELLDELRQNKIQLEQLQVLALADDHATQNRVWFGAGQWERDVHSLRGKIVGQATRTGNNAAFKYVGATAFEAAGGFILRDLWDSVDNGYTNDLPLLESLAAEKLLAFAKDSGLEHEGWGWLSVVPKTLSWADANEFLQMTETRREANEIEQAELDSIEQKIECLQAALENGDETEESLEPQFEALEAQREAIEKNLVYWSDEDKSRGGVLLSLDSAGNAVVMRGKVRREDAPKNGNSDNSETEKPSKAVHSAALVGRLSAHRTAAVMVEISKQPDVALVLLTHRLLVSVFYRGYDAGVGEPLKIHHTNVTSALVTNAPDMQSSAAWQFFESTYAMWAAALPEHYEQSFEWLLAWEQEKVLHLLAFLTSLSVNGLQQLDGFNKLSAMEAVLKVDMNQYWKPTKDAYFQHVSKGVIVDVVSKAVSPEKALPLADMKKGEAAAAAELLMESSHWLPVTLSGASAGAKVDVSESSNEDETE